MNILSIILNFISIMILAYTALIILLLEEVKMLEMFIVYDWIAWSWAYTINITTPYYFKCNKDITIMNIGFLLIHFYFFEKFSLILFLFISAGYTLGCFLRKE